MLVPLLRLVFRGLQARVYFPFPLSPLLLFLLHLLPLLLHIILLVLLSLPLIFILILLLLLVVVVVLLLLRFLLRPPQRIEPGWGYYPDFSQQPFHTATIRGQC